MGIMNDATNGGSSPLPRPGGRLELLVNNVYDVVGLRRNLKELNRITDFCTTVMSLLKPEDVLTAAAWKLHEYFKYKLLVFSDRPDRYENARAFYSGENAGDMSGHDQILRRFPGLRAETLKDHRSLGLSFPQCSDIDGFENHFELQLNVGFVRIISDGDLLGNHSAAFITRIFDILAICMRNAGDYCRVKEDSMRDGLTGLFNRRVLEEMLELEQRKRKAAPLSLLLIDLDNFKAINDTFGHPAGDAVLRIAAETLTENARGSDMVVRYGGEEFAVMLPSASASVALDVGERLRKCIESKVVEYNGNLIRVTASLGIAHRCDKDTFPVKEIMSQADEALYRAKKTGKNKVCFYSSSPVLVGNSSRGACSGQSGEPGTNVETGITMEL